MPAMMMGSAAVFIDCDECWKLLLVTRRGLLYVWDLFNRTCLLHDSLSSLVTTREGSTIKDAGMNFRLCYRKSNMLLLFQSDSSFYDMLDYINNHGEAKKQRYGDSKIHFGLFFSPQLTSTRDNILEWKNLYLKTTHVLGNQIRITHVLGNQISLSCMLLPITLVILSNFLSYFLVPYVSFLIFVGLWLRHYQSYICKVFKIRVAPGCSCYPSCISF